MTLLPSLLKARDKAGADTPKGRRMTVLSQLVQLVHVGGMDPDHERRVKGIMQGVEADLRALIAADRVGARS
jgi:hypothetical protein